jgi:hypothetical protein
VATRSRPSRKRSGTGKHAANVERFLLEYEANGFNGVRAYLAVHPTCKVRTAATNAWRLLKKADIRARAVALRQKRLETLAMEGAEAAQLLAETARADPRDLYDDQGKLLPVHLWPDHIAHCVKAIRGDAVVLHDSQAAQRLVLEMTGKLKSPLAPIADLAAILAGKFHEGE